KCRIAYGAMPVCSLLGPRPPFVFGDSYCPSLFSQGSMREKRGACLESSPKSLCWWNDGTCLCKNQLILCFKL
ncbi:unnamed protein product, partial [Bubo scandiacus]